MACYLLAQEIDAVQAVDIVARPLFQGEFRDEPVPDVGLVRITRVSDKCQVRIYSNTKDSRGSVESGTYRLGRCCDLAFPATQAKARNRDLMPSQLVRTQPHELPMLVYCLGTILEFNLTLLY